MKVKETEKTRILKTSDYDLFKYPEERIFRRRVETLKEAMSEKNLSIDLPIIVDNEYNILDGKHRFIANSELGCPIYYKISETSSFLDLLKAAGFTRKPTALDFVLAHRDKLFYRKILEWNKKLPYTIEDIIQTFFSVRLHSSASSYKDFIAGKCEFEKSIDFKLGQILKLVEFLDLEFGYFESNLYELDRLLEDYSYSAEVMFSKFKLLSYLDLFFELDKQGHPDITTLVDFYNEAALLASKPGSEVNDPEYAHADYYSYRPAYPNHFTIWRFYNVSFPKIPALNALTRNF